MRTLVSRIFLGCLLFLTACGTDAPSFSQGPFGISGGRFTYTAADAAITGASSCDVGIVYLNEPRFQGPTTVSVGETHIFPLQPGDYIAQATCGNFAGSAAFTVGSSITQIVIRLRQVAPPGVGIGFAFDATVYVGMVAHVGWRPEYVKGDAGVELGAFTLTANEISDAKVTSFTVDPRASLDGDDQYDDAVNSVIVSATLYLLDGDQETVLDGPRSVSGSPGSETIRFENFGNIIGAGQTALYIVRCDLASTAGANDDDRVALTIQDGSNVVAQDTDANSVIIENAMGGQPISPANAVNDYDPGIAVWPSVFATVASGGFLTIAAFTYDPIYQEHLVQMGATNQLALHVEAFGGREDILVTDITVSIAGNPANLSSATITYPVDLAQTTFASIPSVFVGGTAVFSGLNWFVPLNVFSDLAVTVDINTDANGASAVQDGSDTSGVMLSVQGATGIISGSAISASGSAEGNPLRVRKTVITISKHPLSPSGVGIAPGVGTYLLFTIANGSGDTATVSRLSLQLSAWDSGGTDWVCPGGSVDMAGIGIYDMNDPATNLVTSQAITYENGSCNADAAPEDVYYIVTFGTPITISAGFSRDFRVMADTSGASAAGDDVFRVDIAKTVAGVTDGPLGTTNVMIWNDGLADHNSYLVDSLPVTGNFFSF